MADEKQDATAKLVARMDAVADALLKIVESENTSDVQKGRLFSQVLAWTKARKDLMPSGDGDKLKDMSDAIKSKGSGRKGNTGRGNSDRTAADGKAIAAIIKRLPKPGSGGAAAGDKAGAERESLGGNGAGGGIPLNGGGDGVGNVDGARNLN